MYIDTFKRMEIKFMMDKYQYENFLEKIKPYMQLDEYGLTTICNEYFDTDNFNLVKTSLEKPLYKEKLRLRSYTTPDENTNVFLEIKKKYKGVVYKRRISAPLHEMKEYIKNGVHPKSCKNKQILGEIDYFLNFYKCMPKVYLAYDRLAFYGKDDKNFRITIDSNIRSRTTNINLEKGDAGKLLLDNKYILEVKVLGAFPVWLTNILSELKIYKTSFSKYGEVYKNQIIKNSEENKNDGNINTKHRTDKYIAC